MNYTSYVNFCPNLESSTVFKGLSKYKFKVTRNHWRDPWEKEPMCQWEEIYANDSGEMVITGMLLLEKPIGKNTNHLF